MLVDEVLKSCSSAYDAVIALDGEIQRGGLGPIIAPNPANSRSRDHWRDLDVGLTNNRRDGTTSELFFRTVYELQTPEIMMSKRVFGEIPRGRGRRRIPSPGRPWASHRLALDDSAGCLARPLSLVDHVNDGLRGFNVLQEIRRVGDWRAFAGRRIASHGRNASSVVLQVVFIASRRRPAPKPPAAPFGLTRHANITMFMFAPAYFRGVLNQSFRKGRAASAPRRWSVPRYSTMLGRNRPDRVPRSTAVPGFRSRRSSSRPKP